MCIRDRRLNIDVGGHAALCVLGDLAMEHPPTRLLVTDCSADRRSRVDDHGVFPAELRLGDAIAIEHLEEMSVHMDRMLRFGFVHDLEHLDIAEANIDRRVEWPTLTVDEKHRAGRPVELLAERESPTRALRGDWQRGDARPRRRNCIATDRSGIELE